MPDNQTTGGEKLLYCSFCGKSQHDVKKLIAGPSVYICDECVDLCQDIISAEATLMFDQVSETAESSESRQQVSPQSLPLDQALHQAGRLSTQEAKTLNQKAIEEKISFVNVLLQSGSIDDQSLAIFCSKTYGLPLFDLTALNASTTPDSILDAQWIQAHGVIPLAKNSKKVFVAISDPTNTAALDQIRARTGLIVESIIVEHAALLQLIEKGSHQA